MLKLDRIDRHILELMQENGRISNLELAELVGLSPSPCSRRVKALEDAGLIDTHVTLLNARQLGLTLTAYIHISMDRHTPERFENFDNAVKDLPEVLECFSVSGNADYVLRIVAPDLAAFSELMMKRVLRLPGIANIKTDIVLGKVKQTHVLPLEHIARPSRPRRGVRYSAG